MHSRFATPGPGTYRPPSDFGYMDMKKHGKTDFDGSMMTGNIGGNFSTTENTSRWENKLATPANYSTIAHSEKKGKPLRAFRNSGFEIDGRQPNSSTLKHNHGIASPVGPTNGQISAAVSMNQSLEI